MRKFTWVQDGNSMQGDKTIWKKKKTKKTHSKTVRRELDHEEWMEWGAGPPMCAWGWYKIYYFIKIIKHIQIHKIHKNNKNSRNKCTFFTTDGKYKATYHINLVFPWNRKNHLFFIGKVVGKGILIVSSRKSVWWSRGYNSNKKLLPKAKETRR